PGPHLWRPGRAVSVAHVSALLGPPGDGWRVAGSAGCAGRRSRTFYIKPQGAAEVSRNSAAAVIFSRPPAAGKRTGALLGVRPIHRRFLSAGSGAMLVGRPPCPPPFRALLW